jgi:hypothetical protein
MSYDWTLWGLFILLGLATTLPRASFIVLGERAALPWPGTRPGGRPSSLLYDKEDDMDASRPPPPTK